LSSALIGASWLSGMSVPKVTSCLFQRKYNLAEGVICTPDKYTERCSARSGGDDKGDGTMGSLAS